MKQIISNNFYNKYKTKWRIERTSDDNGGHLYEVHRVDTDGRLKRWGIFDSASLVTSEIDSVETPFTVTLTERIKTRQAGQLPLQVDETKETYEVGYMEYLCWHKERMDMPNNVTITVSRLGLTYEYRNTDREAEVRRVFKCPITIFADSRSTADKGSVTTDNWSYIQDRATKDGSVMVCGPFDVSHIYRNDGAWVSWGLRDDTVIGLMKKLIDIGQNRVKLNVAYDSIREPNRQYRMIRATSKVGRRAAVMGTDRMIDDGTAVFAVNSVRYSADGGDSFHAGSYPLCSLSGLKF